MTNPPPSYYDRYSEGLKHLANRRLEGAESCFLEIIHGFQKAGETAPAGDGDAVAGSYFQLGLMAFNFKNLTEALWYLNAARKLGMASAECDLNIAICNYAIGNLDEAEAGFGKLTAGVGQQDIAAYPGRIEYARGKALKALEIFQGLVSAGRADAEILIDLGLAAESLGRLQIAKNAYAEALRISPDVFKTQIAAVDQYMTFEVNRMAATTLKKAERVAPPDAEVFFGIGLRYYTLGLFEEAKRAYWASLKISPILKSFWELASLLEKANDLAAAKAATRVPLYNFPDEPRINQILALCDLREGQVDEAKVRLLKIIEAPMDANTRANVLNTLGKIYDREGQTADAYASFQASKDALRETDDYKALRPAATLEILDTMAGLDFKALAFPAPERQAHEPDQMVFFVGFPRSGTTLVENILAGHPSVTTTEENSILLGPISALERTPGGYPAALKGLTRGEAENLRQRYFIEAQNFLDIDGARVLIDKLPLNIIHAPAIFALFPDAKFIFGMRHPMATALSCLMQNFDLNNSMANLMSIDDITALYAKTMTLWAKFISETGVPHHTVRYEDVIADTEAEARKLAEFLDLDWSKNMLRYVKRAKARGLISTPSYSQVVQPIYQDSLERWRRYGEYFAPFKERLKSTCDLYGYTL